MTREKAIKEYVIPALKHTWNDKINKEVLEALEEEPCEDVISRKSIKHKLQEHHDFFVNAYGGFSNLPLNDKSRVDEITNCIAMVVNEPPVTPQPRWIPVSERLPENKETVLVTFKHFVSGNTIGLGSVILLRDKPHWHVREQNLGTYDVLAWKPLPESYKAESDIEIRKPCINYEDGCEEWAGCPCVYYKGRK